MKGFLLFVLFVMMVQLISAQEKPPETGDDYASVMAGDTVTLNVMENDWCMEGHTMKILNVFQGEGGVTTWEDSCITYSSYFYYSGVDTVRYVLIDEVNGLFSDPGNIAITVDNAGRKNIDINNIDATFNSFGYQFCTLPGYTPEFTVPKGSGRKSIFNYSLWLGGKNSDDQLFIAGERYRLSGEDYFPGPVSELYLNAQYIDWNIVSKVSREDVDYHRAHWWEPEYEPAENISNWPAHGDVSIGQHYLLAPFFDRDGDGQYNPGNGDSPFLKGDQAIWNVYNDDMDEHSESGGERIGAEIQMMAFAFDCPDDSVFNHTLFLQYNIINRSLRAYNDFFAAAFIDFDLGYPWDDYVGCDTNLNGYFVYNGDDFDETDNVFGNTFGYGEGPPAQAVVFLNKSLSSFIATNNFNSIMSDPQTPGEYYNIMNGYWKGGEPITYGGQGYGGDIPVKFQFPGDPSNPEEWSEVSAANNPDDRRGIGAMGPFDFLPGDTLQIDLAFVFAWDYEGNNLSSVNLLKDRIETLRWYYDNDSTPCGASWSSMTDNHVGDNNITVYPNPCTDFITVSCEIKKGVNLHYTLSDLNGITVARGNIRRPQTTVPVSNLSQGIYILKVKDGISSSVYKIVKK